MDHIRDIEFATYGVTVVHPLALGFTLAMGVLLLLVRRSHALLPFALVLTLMPEAQRIVVASLDFNMARLLVLFGWARVAIRGEIRPLRFNGLDWALIVWLTASSLVYFIREGSLSSLVYRIGFSFDAAGVYFLFRLLVRTHRDLIEPMRLFAWICIFVAPFMAVEWLTGRNYFSIFGGVSEFTFIRDGRLRCQAAFAHPILAGSFGSSLVPIFVGLAVAIPRFRVVGIVGLVSSTFITIASASSGPVLSWLAALIGWGLWRFRAYLRQLRWGVVAVLIVLHLVREKPVWHLIGRLGDLVGGTGYHRYYLIDAFIRNFDEWWLMGIGSTANWGWGLQDVTNQYVFEGITGGLLGFIAFVTMLTFGFRLIGKALRRAKRTPQPFRSRDEYLAWGLGVSLAVHCVSFMSITYFGQMQMMLYLLLALIASLERVSVSQRRSPAPVPPGKPKPPPYAPESPERTGRRGRRAGATVRRHGGRPANEINHTPTVIDVTPRRFRMSDT